MTRISTTAIVLAAAIWVGCSGNSSGATQPPKKDPVLWECECSFDSGLGTFPLSNDEIAENERCGRTDPANSLEDKHKDWTCDPCTATATLCTKQ